MARIRSIKPEFPQSETMGKVSRDARLLFVQLWTICDDDGRTRAAPRLLASLLYPYDDDARKLIAGWLDELEGVAAIRRYVVNGDSYLDIPNWLKHQKIDKPSKSRMPEYVAPVVTPAADTREDSRRLARIREGSTTDLGRDLGVDLDQDREGNGSGAHIARLTPRPMSPTDLQDLWNAHRGDLPKCQSLSDKRKRTCQQRIRERPKADDWVPVIQRMAASDFCCGRTGGTWIADFDFLLKPDTVPRVLEGKYDNRQRLRASGSRTGDSMDAAERFLRREIGHEFEEFDESEVIDVDPSGIAKV